MKSAFELQTYKSEIKPTWCPGCGDFAVLNALQKAIHALQLEPWNVVIVSGIGCSSNLPHFLSTYGFHSIHGRSIPVATGIKLANPDLHVLVTGGDGDGYGIGLGHTMHAMRRNLDITYLVMNNQVYGLTTGQASPTAEKGMKTKSTPNVGVIENPIDPISLAIASGATVVALVLFRFLLAGGFVLFDSGEGGGDYRPPRRNREADRVNRVLDHADVGRGLRLHPLLRRRRGLARR
ncbi:MAG: thiamine pyrophosphate-dependent enzyme, partial [Methanobacteriota archaeon]